MLCGGAGNRGQPCPRLCFQWGAPPQFLKFMGGRCVLLTPIIFSRGNTLLSLVFRVIPAQFPYAASTATSVSGSSSVFAVSIS